MSQPRPRSARDDSSKKAAGFTPWPEQDENGVDLTLIRANLELTPLERLRQADRVYREMLRLQEIGRSNLRKKPARKGH